MELASTLVLLAISSFKDLKTRTVNIYVTLFFLTAGIVFYVCFDKLSFAEICGGICVGGLFFLASFLTKDSIGRGDAYVVLAMGALLGGYNTIIILICSLFISGVVAFVLLVIKKEDKNKELPFVPFLLVSFVLFVVFK